MTSASLIPLGLAFLLGYLHGSIPFGLIFARLAGLGDLRELGSGNIGATNALREGGKKLAIATLLFDILKGFVPVIIAANWMGDAAALAACTGAIIGHVFPLWLGFRGGKGVATYIGVLLALNTTAGLIFLGIWLFMAAVFRISSLSALTASAAIPFVLWAMGDNRQALFIALLSVLIFVTHRQNIKDLLSGKEEKITSK